MDHGSMHGSRCDDQLCGFSVDCGTIDGRRLATPRPDTIDPGGKQHHQKVINSNYDKLHCDL